jgi:hypothetical protein
MVYVYVSVTAVVLLLVYLWLANRAMTKQYPEAYQHIQIAWTDTEMKKVYDEAQEGPVDVKPFLPPKQDRRRYIVLGGSGTFSTPESFCCAQGFWTPYAKPFDIFLTVY